MADSEFWKVASVLMASAQAPESIAKSIAKATLSNLDSSHSTGRRNRELLLNVPSEEVSSFIEDLGDRCINELRNGGWVLFQEMVLRGRELDPEEWAGALMAGDTECIRNKYHMLVKPYTKVLFTILRLNSQSLGIELRERIIGGNASIESLSLEYGNGPERYRCGRFGPIFMTDLNRQIAESLEQVGVDDVPQLFTIEGQTLLVRLIEKSKPDLSDDSLLEIGEHMLTERINELTAYLSSNIRSGSTKDDSQCSETSMEIE